MNTKQPAPARRFSRWTMAAGAILLAAVVIAVIVFLVIRMWGYGNPFAELLKRHMTAQNTSSAPYRAVPDPRFTADSRRAEQILIQHGINGPRRIVHQPQTDVKPLAAGFYAEAQGIDVYRCNMEAGAVLTEIAPDHQGHILVIYSPVHYMPPVLPLRMTAERCQGGETLFETQDELEQIAS